MFRYIQVIIPFCCTRMEKNVLERIIISNKKAELSHTIVTNCTIQMKILLAPCQFRMACSSSGMLRPRRDYAARREMTPDLRLAGPASRREPPQPLPRPWHTPVLSLPIISVCANCLSGAIGDQIRTATRDSSVGTSALERTSRDLGEGGKKEEYTPAKGRRRERERETDEPVRKCAQVAGGGRHGGE